MDDLNEMMVRVRADREGFAREVAGMRDALEGALEAGAGRGGRAIEGALLRAVRTGKLGFDDLKASALRVMDEIAAAALKAGIGAILGGGSRETGGRGVGVGGGIGGLLIGLAGLPGRATGGPVAPGRAYRVGEQGPELFVPTATGRVVPNGDNGGGGRNVRVAITVNAGNGVAAPEALSRSGRQVARAVRAALREE